MSSLVVPCFLWHSPPSHTITASLWSPDGTRFCTGSDTGIICIWQANISKDQCSLVPQIVLLGNDIAITALEFGKYDLKDVLISSSSDGSIAVWSILDGQCLATKSHALKNNPTQMKLLPDQQHIAVCGNSLTLEILSLETLRVVCRMHGHEDWIRCIDSYMRDGSPAIMSICDDSTVRVWLYGEAARKSDLTDLPIQASLVEMGKGKPQSAKISPNGSMLLVVIDGKCKLFTMGTFKSIWQVECGDYATSCVAAHFVDDFTILIWSRKGRGYLHRIPRSALNVVEADRAKSRPSQGSDSLSSRTSTLSSIQTPLTSVTASPSPAVGTTLQDILARRNAADGGNLELVRIPQNWRLGEPGSSTLIAELSMRREPGMKPAPLNDVHLGLSSKNVAYICHDNGQVELWRIPDQFSGISSMAPVQLISDCVAQFSDGWPVLPPLSLSSSIGEAPAAPQPTAPARFVTASAVLEKELQMICGYSDGTISLSKLPTDSSPVTWTAHRSKVNCLLLLRRDRGNYLISGSNDFYVKVWDLSTIGSTTSSSPNEPRLVHTFSNHSGPVRSLFMPDPETAPRAWKNRFFSIGEDRAVALYQVDSSPHCVNIYGSHPASVSFVKWRPEQDYLFVVCIDGSLSIWEMAAGQLESTIYGDSVKEILEGAYHLSREDKQAQLKTVARQAVTGTTIQLKRDSPVQVVILNVKLLIADLLAGLKTLVPSPAAGPASGTPSKSTTDSVSSNRSATMASVKAEPPGGVSRLATATHRRQQSAFAGIGGASSHHEPADDTAQQLRAATLSRLAPIGSSGSASSSSAGSTNASSTVTPSASAGASIAMRAALHLPSYRVCTYLLPWMMDQELDQAMVSTLYLKPPKPQACFGSIGSGGRLSILVPRWSEGGGRWTFSDQLTAVHSLSSTAVAKALLQFDEQHIASSQLLSFFVSLLPDKVPNYVEPSLATLSNYWQDAQDEVMQATRSLFSSVLNRLPMDLKRQLAQNWGLILKASGGGSASAVLAAPLLAPLPPHLQSLLQTPQNTQPQQQAAAALAAASVSAAPFSPGPNLTSRTSTVTLASISSSNTPNTSRTATQSLSHPIITVTGSTPSTPTGSAAVSPNVSSGSIPVSTSTLSSSGLIPSTAGSSSPGGLAVGTGGATTEAALRTKLRSQAVIVLAILGCEYPDALSQPVDLVREVTAELLHLILEDNPVNRLRVTAAELLGKGFQLWSTYVGDAIALIQKLLKLTLITEPKGLAKAAKRALMLIASRDARRFIHAIGYRFNTEQAAMTKPGSVQEVLGPKEHSQALSLLSRLVKRYPAEFLMELPLLIESVVRSLDPHVPLLREVSLKPATTLVHDLVMRYPMISFDQEEQRLAVGTKDGPIFIYDLNSATRWHVLEGHKAAVSALAFNENGKMMILGSDPHCYKTYQTTRPDRPITPAILLESVRLQWQQSKAVVLLRAWERSELSSVSFKV